MECVIYNIITKDGLYIGSTTNFKRRCIKHKESLKSGKLFLLYENIRKNNGQYKIENILDLVCEDKLELRKIEEEYRILCGANLNESAAFTSSEDKHIRKTETITCVCGQNHAFSNRARHFKSKKHQAYLASL